MSDIIFDLKNNDIGTSNGDFAVVVDPSIQNATLMLLKNPVNILQPQRLGRRPIPRRRTRSRSYHSHAPAAG